MIYRWIVVTLRPLIEFFGKIFIAFKKPSMNGESYKKICDVIQTGDVLLSYTRGELSNIFTKDELKHSAIYVGSGFIVEAVGKGVVTDLISNFCFKKDRVVIVRHPDMAASELAAKWAIDRIGSKYDMEFESGDTEYYCYELVGSSFEKTSQTIKLSKKKILDGQFYTCETFLKDPFKEVLDTRKF